MNTPNFLKKQFIGTVIILFSLTAFAQTASIEQPKPPNQKLFVSLQLTPSVKEFKAGVASVENFPDKLKLWISNADEKKCFITISSSEGQLWSNYVTDAWFCQVFDFSMLEDGAYNIKISNGKESFVKNFVLSTDSRIERVCKIE